MAKQRVKAVLWSAGLLLCATPWSAAAQDLGALISQTLRGTQDSAVVLDWNSGKVVASAGKPLLSNPGSAIKPLLLNYALEHGIVQAETRVYCHRNLHINGLALACTHSTDSPVLDARTALAESCNTWFAEMGRRFTGPQLESALLKLHLPHASMRDATVEQRQLAVLGLRSVSASPMELARAYHELMTHLSDSNPVWIGLLDAVNYGMSNPAGVSGITILGKTGTASDPRKPWTHGWFAGGVPGRFVVVIYVPHGDGGDAARLAGDFVRSAIQRKDR